MQVISTRIVVHKQQQVHITQSHLPVLVTKVTICFICHQWWRTGLYKKQKLKKIQFPFICTYSCTRLYKSCGRALNENFFLGGNIIYVGHASSLDLMVLSLKRLDEGEITRPRATYLVNQHVVRVPYCSLGAMMDKPFEVVAPPCPPCVNTSCSRFDWRVLLESQF